KNIINQISVVKNFSKKLLIAFSKKLNQLFPKIHVIISKCKKILTGERSSVGVVKIENEVRRSHKKLG
uniref:hypothetical protein n=1 Tax=uncultured Treponema sp. TaxID=162155 RepID=UPI0026224185